jgi:hypothetical protein
MDRGLELVAGKDAGRDRLLVGRHLCWCVGCFIVPSRDVVKFEAVKLVLQSVDFLAARGHLGVVATRVFHNLVDDKLQVASDIQPSDAQLDGDA